MDLGFASARRLAAMVRRRRIGCLELLDHMIERIERIDGRLNAVVVRDFERARRRARALDRRGATGSPLHGVPITVKESFDVAGLPTTWGFPEQREHVPEADALAVSRLIGGGGGGGRQDQRAARARRLAELQRRLWHDQQPVGRGAHAGRLVRRRGGGTRRRPDRARAGQRHRRLDPGAGALLRRLWPQADLGPAADARPLAGGGGGDDRHLGDRSAGALGRRPGAGALAAGRAGRAGDGAAHGACRRRARRR